MTRLRLFAAALLLMIGAIALHDSLRSPCGRISNHAWSWLLSLTGLDPWAAPRDSLEQELKGFRLDDPWTLGGVAARADWKAVQGAELTVVPELDLVLISPPQWKAEASRYLADFGSENPTARPLTGASDVPRFLLLQLGGGVERLTQQILLTADGELRAWDLGLFSKAERLGAPSRRSLGQAIADRLFELAENSDIPAGRIRFEGTCNALDGGVTALTYFDGNQPGRVQFNNNRRPTGPLARIAGELQRQAGKSSRQVLD